MSPLGRLGRPVLTTLCGCLLALGAFARQDPLRVSGHVYRDGRADPALTDLLLVELSQLDHLQAVQREEIELVFDEWESSGFVADKDSQVRLGALFSVDLFVWLSYDSDGRHGSLEVVDASTGLVVSSEVLVVESSESLTALAGRVAQRVEDLVAAFARTAELADGTVAFTDVALSPYCGVERDQAMAFLGALRDELDARGVPLLHREQVGSLIRERWLAEKGFSHGLPRTSKLLGAEYLVSLQFDAERSVSVWVLSASRGLRIAQKDFAPAGPEIAAWIQQAIERDRAAEEVDVREPPPVDRDLLQPETLEPLYQGILLYDGGHYLEAVDRFRDALQRDARFREPYEWIRCAFEAAGFAEIGAAVERYVQQRQEPWHGLSAPKLFHAEPGISFLGARVHDPALGPLERSLSFLLVDLLHEASGSVVFLPEDLSALRAEYDVLVGLEGTRGISWETAPSLVLRTTASAHLRTHSDGYRLEVRYTDLLSPHGQSQHAVALPRETERWPELIRATLRGPRERLTGNDLPPASIGATEAELLACLAQDYSDADFLKLLTLAPDRVEFMGEWRSGRRSDLWYSLDFGLKQWLLRSRPETPESRPWQQLIFLCEFMAPGHGRVFPGITQVDPNHDYIGGLHALVDEHPSHPAARIARFNLSLNRLRPDNYAEIKSEIDQLLEELAPQTGDVAERMRPALESWSAILAIALDQPHPADVELRFYDYLKVSWEISGEPTVYAFPVWTGDLKDSLAAFSVESLPREVNLRLRLLPAALRHEDIAPPLLRELAEDHDESEIVAVLVKQFLSSMSAVHWEERARWRREDLIALYEYQSARVIARLRDDAPPKSIYDLSHCIRSVMTPTVSFRWMGRDARLWACQSLLREHTALAIGHWREQGLSAHASKTLLRALDTWPREEDPWVESVLLDLAEDSWSRGSPTGWLDFAAWKGERSDPRELARLHGPHLDRLRAIYAPKEKTVEAQKVFSQFALDLYRGEADAAAEELYEELLAWNAVAGAEDEVALYRANACLLLALLHKRAGNVPEALRLARQAVAESGEREFGLLYRTYGSSGWAQNLKPYAVRFIDALRRDPDAPFEDPFENFRPEPSAASERPVRSATPDPAETQVETSTSDGTTLRASLLALGALALGVVYAIRRK